MIITRETDYALRLLKELSDGKRYSAPELSEKGAVSLTFAYKILKKLERAGMVAVSRGASGGCRLSADLDRVSLYDLVEALEGNESLSLHVNACTVPGYQCSWCESHGDCKTHEVLERIQDTLAEELKSHSLSEIIGCPVCSS